LFMTAFAVEIFGALAWQRSVHVDRADTVVEAVAPAVVYSTSGSRESDIASWNKIKNIF
jgi:hypothetical protein